MRRKDYSPEAMTPLYDAIGKAIAHGEGLATEGDRVMIMVDTDGYENSSKEHTQESIRALVDQKKEAGWAFLFMAGGIDTVQAGSVGDAGDRLGMAVQRAPHSSRSSSHRISLSQSLSYFESGIRPVSVDVDDDDAAPRDSGGA